MKGCSECGSQQSPEYLCSDCSATMEHVEVHFKETASTGATLTEEVWAHRCPNCARVYISEVSLDDLEEFVGSMPPNLRILPELGIQTDETLEVFVAVNDHPVVSLTSETLALKITLGYQSELFQKCVYRITRWDTSDYGHDLSSTLVIEPAPPYGSEQRRELQLLFSQLSRSVKAPLDFWTLGFEPYDEDDPAGPLHRLALVVETWRLDPDRSALSLVTKTIGGSAQGPFINIFRLLELVLKRQAEDELARSRLDAAVSHEQFLAKIRSLDFDLAGRLRNRVRTLSNSPDFVLRSLWDVLVPERGYNADEVFNKVAKLRNQNAHEPSTEEALRLPWEELPFVELTDLVATLIAEMITRYEEDVVTAFHPA
jgi:hypothetical protein